MRKTHPAPRTPHSLRCVGFMVLIFSVLCRAGDLQAQPGTCALPAHWSPVDYEISDVSEGIAGDTLTGQLRFLSVFTIDSVLTIRDAVLGVSQSPIIINPGDTLRLYNTLVISDSSFSGNLFPWAGIRIRPGGVLIMDSSTICFANTAVWSEGNLINAGEYIITNSLLRQNAIGLQVEDYSAGIHPGRVWGTNFRGGLFPPTFSSYSVAGIYVKNVSDGDSILTQGLQIGNVNGASNRFDSLEVGIL